MVLDSDDVNELEALIKRSPDFQHLYVKKRGSSLTIFSGDPPNPHVRLTALECDLWALSFPTHTGRWERTPFVGTMEEVFKTLITNFRFYLDDVR